MHLQSYRDAFAYFFRECECVDYYLTPVLVRILQIEATGFFSFWISFLCSSTCNWHQFEILMTL